MHSPVHSAAYVLHPRYADEPHNTNADLWADFNMVATRVLGSEKAALALPQYTEIYRQGKGTIGWDTAQLARETTVPANWWASYGSSCPELQMLALKILSLPGSASSSEQNWSVYDYVHSKRRNKLKSDRASKLVFVYSSLRLTKNRRSYHRFEKTSSNHVTSKSIVATEDNIDGNPSDTELEDCALDEGGM